MQEAIDHGQVALPAKIRRLLFLQMLMNTSHFMTVPLLALYMSRQLRFAATELATVMAVNLFCAQAFPLAAGAVADRIGADRMITLGLLLRGGGFLGFGLVDAVPGWVGCACLAGTGVACYEGGLYGVLGRQHKVLLPVVFATNNQMLNIGTALGPMLGALVGLGGVPIVFVASAVLFLVLAAVASCGRFGGPVVGERRTMQQSLGTVARHPGLRRVALVSLPWFFLFPQLYVAFPLYARQIAGSELAPMVYVVNGLVGVGFMFAMKRRLARACPTALISGVYLVMAVAFASVPLVRHAGWFLLFVAAYTMLETLMMPTWETLVGALAVEGSEATFFGALSAVGALTGCAGYYAGSWLILHRPAFEAWTVFGGVGALGYVLARVMPLSERPVEPVRIPCPNVMPKLNEEHHMKRRYVTADVFTRTRFMGNPVAVVLDAQGLSTAQMQSIANEFAYSETTFVLPPRDAAHTACVRIFTASREIPFAGHPNIGTAFVLASAAAQRGEPLPDTLRFEELAGLVPVRQWREDGTVTGAELIAPEPLSCASEVAPARAAACLSLSPDDIRTATHRPRVVSVGLPFLVVELHSREALSRCLPDRGGFRDLLPLDDAVSLYVYTRAKAADGGESDTDIQSRMFTPHMTEDPATGSATGALVAYLAHLGDLPRLSVKVGQGSDMGRHSTLFATAEKVDGSMTVRVGGHCVRVLEGTFDLDPA